MARIDSMAKIDAALASVNPATSKGADLDETSADVSIAPGLSTDAPLSEMTADQKRAFDARRQQEKDQQAAQEKLANEQDAALKQQIATDKAEEDAFKASARATVQGARSIVRGTGATLGNLPQPGSILLPLVVLMVSFLLLIPVNGHTRFVWLWMVLSNNAVIGQASVSAGSSAPTTTPGGDTGSGNTTAAPALVAPAGTFPATALSAPQPGLFATYVEGM